MDSSAKNRRVRVVMQARTSSSRLPAKVLLPIAGVPIAVLVAKRFLRFGHDTVIATSTEATDDLLVAETARWELRCVRGSLDNVLQRFGDATMDLELDDICVRLTADNVFPDGEFLNSLIEEFSTLNCDYLNNAQTLPYGLGAELFSVRSLRNAMANADTQHDLEHVTPWIKRNCLCRTSSNDFGFGNLRALRCTIDNLDDYLSIAPLFPAQRDPSAVGFRELTTALLALRKGDLGVKTLEPGIRPVPVLGTAQLGMAYGRANRSGKPSLADGVGIIRQAARSGVSQFDTARAYGDSETVLGHATRKDMPFPVTLITKLAPFPADHEALGERVLVGLVEGSVYRSLFELQTNRLPVLLLHRASQLQTMNGAVWRRLVRFRDEGLIGKLGASVQTPEELESVRACKDIEHVQLPFNLLDRRWDAILNSSPPQDRITFHVRSVFLQGLLASEDPTIWPAIEELDPAQLIAAIGGLAERFGRESRRDLCLAFARAAPWVDGVLIGVETTQQLNENLRLFAKPPLSAAQFQTVRQMFNTIPADLLDPSRWL